MYRFCVSALLVTGLMLVALLTPEADAQWFRRPAPQPAPVYRPVQRPVVIVPPAPANEQKTPTQAEQGWRLRDEIARRGNLVEHITPTEGASDDADWAVGAAMELPPDDSNKWFITVISMRGCPACDQVRYDFANAPELQAWVNTRDYKKSWAHYQVISIDDETQKWRFEGQNSDGTPRFKPRVFPTIVVQPPLDGSFGPPTTRAATVEGYLKPAALHKYLQKEVQAYARSKAHIKAEFEETGRVEKLIEAREIPEGVKFNPPFQTDGGAEQSDKVGIATESEGGAEQAKEEPKGGAGGPNAPFDVPSPLGPPQPSPYLPPGPIHVDPTDPSEGVTLTALGAMVFALLGKALGSGVATNLLLLVVAILGFLRWVAPRTKTTVDDRIVALLNRFFVQGSPENPTPAPSVPPVVR